MTDWQQWIRDNSETIQKSGAAMLIVATIWAKSRQVVIILAKGFWAGLPWVMAHNIKRMDENYTCRLDSLKTEQSRQGTQLEKVFNELESNGLGSVKDLVGLMADGWQEELIESNVPRFICDRKGNNIFLSKGYLNMVGVANLDDLKRHAWESFIHEQDVDKYLEAWQQAFKDGRRLITSVRWRNVNGKDIGERVVNARPVGNFYTGSITEP